MTDIGVRARLRNVASATSEGFRDRMANRDPIARVAFNVLPMTDPWGGGNAWVQQQVAFLRQRGYSVRFDLRGPVDCIILASAKPTHLEAISFDEVRRYRESHPSCVCLHRVNDSDAHRESGGVDSYIAAASELADYTVFISAWVRDYHANRWFDRSRPHGVILNGADPRIFHPIGGSVYDGSSPLRIITHHWSDNPAKGFDRYAQLDWLIESGSLPGVELWLVGRWPANIEWRRARLIGPRSGRSLGDALRSCHVYITASRWEAGGMHVVEGLQCGLPLLYAADGGGIAEAAGADAGLVISNGLADTVQEVGRRYHEMRARVLANPPSGDRMALDYAETIQRLIATA